MFPGVPAGIVQVWGEGLLELCPPNESSPSNGFSSPSRCNPETRPEVSSSEASGLSGSWYTAAGLKEFCEFRLPYILDEKRKKKKETKKHNLPTHTHTHESHEQTREAAWKTHSTRRGWGGRGSHLFYAQRGV